MEKEKMATSNPMPLLADLLAMYVVTGLMLVALAAALGHFDLTDAMVNAAIIGIYIISTFIGGAVIGKKKKEKRYLWGLCVGMLYFFVLLLGSLVVNRSLDGQVMQLFTTAIMCAGSGMAGGMVS